MSLVHNLWAKRDVPAGTKSSVKLSPTATFTALPGGFTQKNE